MKPLWRRVLALGLGLVLFFTVYAWFFRTYLNDQTYLNMALAATNYDPSIINADEPAFEVIWYKGRPAVHLVFQTFRNGKLGSISLYIDIFSQRVKDVQRLNYVERVAPFP